MSESKTETVSYVTQEQYVRNQQYYDNQIADLKKKIRLLVRLLVDKKIIGDEIAKSFEETNSSEVLKWYMDKNKAK